MPLLTPIVIIYNTIAVKNHICKVNLRLAFINNLGKTY